MNLLTNINISAVMVLLLFIGVQDVRFRLISNRNIIILFTLVLPMIFLSGSKPNVVLFTSTLILGFILFLANVIGAGDVKLLAVLALSFEDSHFYTFLLIMALIGGFLALIGLLFFHTKTRQSGVPYGMAISLAFIFSYP